MPDVAYGIRMTVGPYSWLFGMGDTLALPCPVDGLQIIRKVVETDLWPPVEDVAECRFQLIAEQATDLADLAVGMPVRVQYDPAYSGGVFSAAETFDGRIGEVPTDPHDLGVVFTVSCLDYTADLREPDVGTVAYPAETIEQRLQRIAAELGQTLTVATFAGQPPETSPMLAARAAAPVKAYDLLNHYLAQWPAMYEAPVGVFHGPMRMQLVPDTDSTGALEGWRVEPVPVNPAYDGVLVLEDVGGLVSAVPNTTGGGAIIGIDGAAVDFDSSYAVTKRDHITAVSVSGDGTGAALSVTASLGVDPPVVATLDGVELSSSADYLALAQMYLPADVPYVRWVADEFLWHLGLENGSLGSLLDLQLVGNIDPATNPSGNAWYAGLLASYTLTVADKRPTYLFQLRRPDFSTEDADDILRWNSPALAGVTWADLNPADSWDDYRLVRSTT